MSPRKIFLMAALALLISSVAMAADPYGQQPPTPSSPYPDMGGAPSPYGNSQQQTSPSQQQGYQSQPQPAPQGGGGMALVDVMGQFRLNLSQDIMPMAATYNFGMPSLGAQVTIMSLAQAQAMAAQRQNFLAMVPQMGGRVTDQRQINVGGRPADLVTVMVKNNQNNQSFVVFNFFITSANLWVQVMGPAQAQAQVQQAANLVLQGLQTR